MTVAPAALDPVLSRFGMLTHVRLLGEVVLSLAIHRLYSSAEELVSDADIDAVFVLTNFETHLKYAKMAMNHGKASV